MTTLEVHKDVTVEIDVTVYSVECVCGALLDLVLRI